MRPRTLARIALALPLALTACIQPPTGTTDRSATVMRASEALVVRSVAVVSVPEAKGIKGLARPVETALLDAFHSEFPTARIVTAPQFAGSLQRNGHLQHFGQWRARYDRTQRFDRRPLPVYARSGGARHLLLVRGTRLDREQLDWAEVEALGCCFAKRGTRYWRLRLTLNAELIDAASGRVVWRGRGEAEQITRDSAKDGDPAAASRATTSLPTRAELESLVPPMISVAASGVAREIASGPAGTSARR
jgi:hypothetical protein